MEMAYLVMMKKVLLIWLNNTFSENKILIKNIEDAFGFMDTEGLSES